MKKKLICNLRLLAESKLPDTLTPALKEKGWCLGIGYYLIQELNKGVSIEKLETELLEIRDSDLKVTKPEWVDLAEAISKIQIRGNPGIGTIIAAGCFCNLAYAQILERFMPVTGQALCFSNHLTGDEEKNSHAVFIYRVGFNSFCFIDGGINEKIAMTDSNVTILALIKERLKFPTLGITTVQVVEPFTPAPKLSPKEWKFFYERNLKILDSEALERVINRVQEWGKDFFSPAITEYYQETKQKKAIFNIKSISSELKQYPWLLSEVIAHQFDHQLLNGYSFTSANLQDCKFTGSELVGADFKNSDLTNADFTKSNLENADFTDAIFSSTTRFDEANISNAVFNPDIEHSVWTQLKKAKRFTPRVNILLCDYLSRKNTPPLFSMRAMQLFNIHDPESALAPIIAMGLFKASAYSELCKLFLQTDDSSLCFTRYYSDPGCPGHLDFVIVSTNMLLLQVGGLRSTTPLLSPEILATTMPRLLSLSKPGVISVQVKMNKDEYLEMKGWEKFYQQHLLVLNSIKLREIDVLLPDFEDSYIPNYGADAYIINSFNSKEQKHTLIQQAKFNGTDVEWKAAKESYPWLETEIFVPFHAYQDLTGQSFAKQNLSKGIFVGANLSGVDFSDAKLCEADLTDAQFDEKTNFTGANLQQVKMPICLNSPIFLTLRFSTLSSEPIHNKILVMLCFYLYEKRFLTNGPKRALRLFQLLQDGKPESLQVVKEFLRTGKVVDPTRNWLCNNPSILLRKTINDLIPPDHALHSQSQLL